MVPTGWSGAAARRATSPGCSPRPLGVSAWTARWYWPEANTPRSRATCSRSGSWAPTCFWSIPTTCGDLDAQCLALCEELRRHGHRPHYVPVSGTTPISCLGYVRAGVELANQLDGARLRPDALYLPFGTGGIAAGIAIGLHAAGKNIPLIGCSVNRPASACAGQFDTLVPKIQTLLGLPPSRLEIEIRDDQLGAGYGKATSDCLAAITELARTEGILLDPVYSGKVAATLLADCRNKRSSPDANVIMLHSGGVPALFAYHDEILDALGHPRSPR